jgi:hypothetical protein
MPSLIAQLQLFLHPTDEVVGVPEFCANLQPAKSDPFADSIPSIRLQISTDH